MIKAEMGSPNPKVEKGCLKMISRIFAMFLSLLFFSGKSPARNLIISESDKSKIIILKNVWMSASMVVKNQTQAVTGLCQAQTSFS